MEFVDFRRIAINAPSYRLLLAAVVLTSFAAASAQAGSKSPVQITSCGQVAGNARLASDLTCSGPADEGFAIRVLDGGSLDLAGHTLTVSDTDASAIRCAAACKVFNGTIVLRGKTRWALDADDRARVSHVEIRIEANDENLREGNGIRGKNGAIESTNITGATGCIAFERVKVLNSRCNDSALFGVMAARAARVKGSSFTASAGNDPSSVGVQGDAPSARVVVSRSSVTGYKKGVASWSPRRPKIVETDCGHSAVITPEGYDGSWGVCAADR